ncbi:hypothetical protein Zmor_017425 [Zophobas morio]|uniref:Odorant receptor n=1 Tax=Zophobas morio TaxID=2755281 RepID=A0AA38I9I6_9CUCU|nr:hypothetical protein Zmor_017425 [Zophobas morio]
MNYDDYMKICRFLVIDVYHLKCVQFVLFSSKLGVIFAVILQTYQFLARFEVDYFVQDGPSYFVALYILTCLLAQPLVTETVQSIAESVEQNNPQSIIKSVPERAKKSAFYSFIYVIWTTMTSVLVAISLMTPTKDDDNLFFLFKLSNMYLSKWNNFFKILCRCFTIPLSYVGATIACFNLLYSYQVINLEVQRCLQQIKKINATKATNQREITKNLKSFLSCLSFSENSAWEAVKRTQFIILPLKIMGSAFMMSIVVFYFWFESSLRDQYFRICAITIMSFTTLLGTAGIGQAIEDYKIELSNALVEVEWYDWDESNKKMYLMLLIHLSKPIKIKFSENISVNYEMGVQMAKTFFSTISVMERLHKSKSGRF